MKAISLKQVTAVVLTCVVGSSYFANANENDTKLTVKAEDKVAEVKVISETKTPNKFAMLIEKFDLNKDGMLSKAEVHSSKSEKLATLFSKIDLNTDSGISEAEFNQYIAQVK
jgi:Ca2+-binding EF-hand superfamily protein